METAKVLLVRLETPREPFIHKDLAWVPVNHAFSGA